MLARPCTLDEYLPRCSCMSARLQSTSVMPRSAPLRNTITFEAPSSSETMRTRVPSSPVKSKPRNPDELPALHERAWKGAPSSHRSTFEVWGSTIGGADAGTVEGAEQATTRGKAA